MYIESSRPILIIDSAISGKPLWRITGVLAVVVASKLRHLSGIE
jgi:hypothetical protein